jgi:PQQ-dependent dehydrogenase (methanol/ethanol family)
MRLLTLRSVVASALLLLFPIAAASADGGNVDWMMYNGNYLADRFSPLTQITPQNAGSMHAVCTFQFGEVGTMQTGPVIHNGVLFVTSQKSTYALDAKTCRVKWKNAYTPSGPPSGITNRGVAIANGKVYRGTPDAHLLAMDEETGKTLWDVLVRDSSDGSSTSAAPIVWKNLIFMGLAGSEQGVKGQMYALDANDGHKVWTFDTIPTGKQTGADTWKNPDSTLTGGGGTWSSFTLDPDTGTLYIPVANPAPDFYPDYRPGANLFTSSIVALDALTGKLRWWYQAIPHDYHDWDVAAAPVVFKAPNGRTLVSFSPKDGNLYTVDNATHKLVYKVPDTTVLNQDLPLTLEGVHYCPYTGGSEWNGPAYSERDKLLFVDTVDWCSTLKLGANTVRYIRGHLFLGGGNGFGEPDKENSGWLIAFDPVSGKAVWKFHAKTPMVAAVTPTAGGVVFSGEIGGDFEAFDSATGKLLYSFYTGGQVAGGVATYAVDGKQYVVAVSGNQSRTAFTGFGAPAVYVFSL